MNLSGILVLARPERVDSCLAALRALPGVEVHYLEGPSGRIVITQEAESVAAEIEGLKRIQALPEVILAELVYHRFEQEPQGPCRVAAEPGDPEGTARSAVLERLNR